MYLPEVWAKDTTRRREAKVPEEIGFATKPAIATAPTEAIGVEHLPGIAVADAGYGVDTAFRDRLTQLVGLGLYGWHRPRGEPVAAGKRTAAAETLVAA